MASWWHPRRFVPLVFCASALGSAIFGGGCEAGTPVSPDNLLPSTEDSSSDTFTNPDATTQPAEANGCPPSALETISAGTSHYYVLTNRQKFIGLEAYKHGVDRDAFIFSITRGPAHGRLIGSAPNLAYLPDADYSGADSFLYEAKKDCTTIRGVVAIAVDSSYVLPIGIPGPEFGIVESHRMYTSASFDFGQGPEPYRDAGNGPYTHYINFNTGSDAGNPFGTAAQPRRTFPTDFPPGSVVEVHGSGYDYQGVIVIRGEGTAAKPIFIRGANPLIKPILRRAIKIESDYIICENLEWDCRDYGTTTTEGVWLLFRERAAPLRMFHHFCARHILMRDCPALPSNGATGIFADVSYTPNSPNNSTDLTEHAVIYDVEIRNFGVWNDFNGSTDYVGCGFARNFRYGWVLDSHVHHIHGDATGMTRTNALSEQAPARNCYFGRNYLHHTKERFVDIKMGVNSVISQNVVHTTRRSGSSNGNAIPIFNNDATAAWPYSDNIWVIFNKIYDAEFGITHHNHSDALPPSADSRSYFIGNIIFDVRAIRWVTDFTGCAIERGSRTQGAVVGNLVFNCDLGISVGLPILPEPERCVTMVRNNIIINLTERLKALTGHDATHIYVAPDTVVPYTTLDHNLHWEDVGNVRINIMRPGLQDGSYWTIEDMVAATGFGVGSLIADPLFVDVGGANFHLQAGSPALGAGLPDVAYTTFTTQFGESINFHFDGTLLPNPPDIGPLGSP